MELYGFMVDLLGNDSILSEEICFINNMEEKPNSTEWVSLLGACLVYKNVTLGEQVDGHIFELDSKNLVLYVILSNIYVVV